jgi:hypothetical protein
MNTRSKTRKRKEKSKEKPEEIPEEPEEPEELSEEIRDPEFSEASHKGTDASSECVLCQGKYNYQDYEVFARYVEHIIGSEGLYYVTFTSDVEDMTIGLDMVTGKIAPYYLSNAGFKKVVQRGVHDEETQLTPIILNLELDDSSNPRGSRHQSNNHANCLVIHKPTKTIELFEPHGYRTSGSTLGGNPGDYDRKLRFLKRYWKKRLPSYTVVNVVDAVKKTAFQSRYDPADHSGYCITWALLYTHYRLLNPTTPYKELIQHIDHKITTRLLLRYAKRVEETMKNEI